MVCAFSLSPDDFFNEWKIEIMPVIRQAGLICKVWLFECGFSIVLPLQFDTWWAFRMRFASSRNLAVQNEVLVLALGLQWNNFQHLCYDCLEHYLQMHLISLMGVANLIFNLRFCFITYCVFIMIIDISNSDNRSQQQRKHQSRLHEPTVLYFTLFTRV